MLFIHDLRIAVRSLMRVRTLWLTIAVTLALGIGANAAIFSVVRAVLLRPLANRDESHLLYLRQSAPGLGVENEAFSVPEIQDLGHGLKTLQQLGTFSEVDFVLLGLGTPREIPAGVVDGNYFQVMGLKPVLGRLLTSADDGPNAAGAVVLTNKFWNTSLHADPGVLGKSIRLGSFQGGRTATIVGVLEPSVPYPSETEIFANIVTSPHHLSATMVTGREHRMTEVFARLAPGATIEAARAELQTSYAAMVAAHPGTYRPEDRFTISLTRIHDQINARANKILWVLFAASGLLFVIACSNVANLVLARTVRREAELAVRSALGATPAALRRSLLAESMVLCGSGVAAALFLAAPMVEVLGRYASRFTVRADGVTLDASLVWTGILLALAAAMFLAFVPRLPAADSSQGLGLSSGTVRVTGSSSRRLRIFAITQISASFLLLAGAGALMKTLLTLEKTQPPFETAHVLAVNLPVVSYGRTNEQVQDFYREVNRRVSALPGVAHVATGFSVPWRDAQDVTLQFAIEGAKRENSTEDPRARFRSISPGFFETLGVPLVEGRDFRDTDRDGSERVVIISQSTARALFPGQPVLNRHLHWSDPVMKFIGISEDPRRIIGVAADVDDRNIIPSPAMTVYQPAFQEGWQGRLFVRAQQDPYALVPSITRTIHDISVDQPVEHATTLQDVRAEVLSPDRLNAIVFGGFAGVALLISVVGVAGVLAFSVSGRMREFGIRVALGALPRDLLTDVLSQGMRIAGIGVATGVALAFGLARLTGQYVTGVQLPGPGLLVSAAFVIMAAAVIASAVPAARAARVNAAETLRSE